MGNLCEVTNYVDTHVGLVSSHFFGKISFKHEFKVNCEVELTVVIMGEHEPVCLKVLRARPNYRIFITSKYLMKVKGGSVVEWLGRCSDHYLELFLGSPRFNSSASLVNSQLVRLLPAGILNHVMLYLKYLFLLFVSLSPKSPFWGEDKYIKVKYQGHIKVFSCSRCY